jgi:phosphoribosylaminoimidazolecarboxamide formyltransferase/IMP cyclohydrolase
MTLKRALISVYDKTGIVNFAQKLSEHKIEIIATDGTFKTLKEAGVRHVKPVSAFTDFPEILEGRVKTMHPNLIGGILALRDNEEHMRELRRFRIEPIDMVVCNLYPFEKVVNQGADLKIALENIDVGGPNLIRGAAKNFENVVVIVKSYRYNQVLREIDQNGDLSTETRRVLAVEAFRETARYESAIYKYLEEAILT